MVTMDERKTKFVRASNAYNVICHFGLGGCVFVALSGKPQVYTMYMPRLKYSLKQRDGDGGIPKHLPSNCFSVATQKPYTSSLLEYKASKIHPKLNERERMRNGFSYMRVYSQ